MECTPYSEELNRQDPTLSSALESISQLASEMNEKKRESEGRQRLLHWHARLGSEFKSPLVQPHRTLLKEGDMILTRVVKRTLDIVANILGGEHDQTSLLQIQSLFIDNTPKRLVSQSL